jgi:hypothetical protein
MKIELLKAGNPAAFDGDIGSIYCPIGTILEIVGFDPSNSKHAQNLNYLQEYKLIKVIEY